MTRLEGIFGVMGTLLTLVESERLITSRFNKTKLTKENHICKPESCNLGNSPEKKLVRRGT